jgi:hypothetical protein
MRRLCYLLIALLLPTMTAQAQDFGRVFFTAQERAALDAARKSKITQMLKAEEPVAQPKAPAASGTVSLHGYLRRNDGRMTLWVNNKMAEDDDTGRGLKVTRGGEHHGSVTVKLPDTSEAIKLKVGQHLDPMKGEVHENWARARVETSQTRVVERPTPAGPALEQGSMREAVTSSEQR